MSIELPKVKAGDIILYQGNTFLSKGIMFFMKRYMKRLKVADRALFSHAALVVEYKGRLVVAEANAKGIEVNDFLATYAKKASRIKILTPKKVYSKTEQSKISDVAISYAFDPTRYDFFNFIFQIDMIRSTSKKEGKKKNKRWVGPKGDKATKKLYCSEAVATWANEVRPNTFAKPWTVNPLDIDLNKYYKTIFNGVS